MQIDAESAEDFLASVSLPAAAGALGAPDIARRRGAAGDDHPSAAAPRHLPRAQVYRRGSAARGRIHRTSATCRCRERRPRQVPPAASDFASTAAWVIIPMDAGESLTALAGVHSGASSCSRTSRSARSAIWRARASGSPRSSARADTCCLRACDVCRARPRTDIDWVTTPRRPMELFAAGRGRRVSRLSARAAGAARPQHRPRDPRHRLTSLGRSISAASCSATGISSATTRSRPSAICGPSSRRPISAPPIRSGQRNAWSMRGFAERFDYALQTLTSSPTTAGASSTPRTRCGSMRCGCTRLA